MAVSSGAKECPECGAPMLSGVLHDGVAPIYVRSHRSGAGADLGGLICPPCGHVELCVPAPSPLERHDIPPVVGPTERKAKGDR
jgi:hypothetical protein